MATSVRLPPSPMPLLLVRRAALLLLAMAFAGCSRSSGPPAGEVAALDAAASAHASEGHDAVLPLPKNAILVPLARQQTKYSCGDVAALAILRYWDYAEYGQMPESELYTPLQTTSENGTDPRPIEAYLNRVPGLRADYVTGATVAQLEAAVARGEPTIVDLEAWQDVPTWRDLKPWAPDWDDGHYVVLVGDDAENLYFMDPSTDGHYAFIPRVEFLDRWHDVVGPTNVHTDHLVVFVHSTRNADAPPPAAPSRTATRMD